MNRSARQTKPRHADGVVALRKQAEARLKQQPKPPTRKTGNGKTDMETQRLLHELQVHQVELEMQNAELQESRDKVEALLAKYTDLYDFAPVGYMSLNDQGRILEVNLTGAALLGMGRAQLIQRRLLPFLVPASRASFQAFLERVLAGTGKEMCEAALVRQDRTWFWANFHGTSGISTDGLRNSCRVAISDITALKVSEEAQRRLEVLGVANLELRREIARRQTVEESLRKSEHEQSVLLERSEYMQEQLRHLSRQVLQAQEEERKRISRELHDVIAQTLTGINLRLANLKKEAGINPRGFGPNLTRTQELVEKSVNLVHRFARELRPAVLDDLGLIPALHSFLKNFTTETGVRTHLTAFAAVEELDTTRRTVLFRVAQEALNNVARHAHASRVEVNIQKLPAGIAMIIKDDGKAFDVKRALQVNGGKHLGLLGMRERLEMVAGNFGVESVPGRGTTITAQIPSGKPRGVTGEKKPARVRTLLF